MNIKKIFFDKYLNSKKKRIIVGCVTGVIALGCGAGIVYATRETTPNLKLNKEKWIIEYGDSFNPDFNTLVNTKDLNKDEKNHLQKNIKIKSNIENDFETIINEDGSTKEKDRGFAKVGDYKVDLIYEDEIKTIKIIVKDSKAPEVTVPETVEVLQGTDLATFDFKSLINATDLAQLNDIQIDYSTVDINTPGEYAVKASVEDVNKNKTEKEFKVIVTAPIAVAADEVVVQEEVTNPDGTKTVKNTVKKKTDASSSGNKIVSGNTSNSGSTGNKPSGSTGGNNGSSNPSGGSTSKPSSGGSTGGNSNNNSSSGNNNSGGSSSNSGNNNSSSGSGGSADVDISGSTPNGDYTDNWGGGQGNLDDIFG